MHLLHISILIGGATMLGCYLLGIAPWWWIPITLVVHLPLFLGVFHPSPSWLCPTVTRGDAGCGRRVALTFDDGPTPVVTPRVLQILKQFDVRATFFCIGRAARRHPDIVRQTAAAGHEIGNHSFFHTRHLYASGERRLRRDILLAQETLRRCLGRPPVVFRPPVGFRSPALARVMRCTGLTLVNFDVRAFDTRVSDPDKIYRRLTKKTGCGSILLLHDGDDICPRPDRTAMLEVLPRLIEFLLNQGYRLVTVSDLLGLQDPPSSKEQ